MADIVPVNATLDKIKMTESGVEYWMARDLQIPLGYLTWRNFEKVVEKARMACESTGTDPNNHIVDTNNMVSIGSGAERERSDFIVSRYGAYLIAMNGDPRLPAIAEAQNYFAIQTRKQEIAEQAQDIDKRIVLRKRVIDANKDLGKAAKESGVQNYGLFHDAGYRGLYGLSLAQIKRYKGLEKKEDLLDRVGRAELAANEFRITQTEQALIRDEIKGDNNARNTHKKVGEEVRKTIEKLGGTMPEDLPTEDSLKIIETKKKKELINKAKRNDNSGKY